MSAKSKRSFGLSQSDVEELTAEYAKTKRFPNPYRAGAYGFTIDGLVSLGANKPHPLAKVKAAFKKAAGREFYDAWTKSEKRNEETGKDADARFVQNLRVLQRTRDYGLKLLEVGKTVLKSKGAVMDLDRDAKGKLLVTLNLDSDTPIKPQRTKAPTQKVTKASVKPHDQRKSPGTAQFPTGRKKKPRKGGKAK